MMRHLQTDALLQGGKYRIERVLGEGGFGNTYVAINTEFDERVAIKEFFMKDVTERDEVTSTVTVSNVTNYSSFVEQKEKFKVEARRLRKLRNPHIVRVHDLFEENGTVYYVMDYINGKSLSEWMRQSGKPFTEHDVRKMLPQILEGLKVIHDANQWHLDIKPANIMMDEAGQIKIIDFGASKQLNVKSGGATTSTPVSYTNGYAPREQMEQNYDKFGPWTDIYALGATLYNLLSNKRPPLPSDIDDDDSEDKQISLPFPEGVSEEMQCLVRCMMQTNRMNRPQRIEDVLALTGLRPKVINMENQPSIGEETLLTSRKSAKKEDEDTLLTSRNTTMKDDEETLYTSRSTVGKDDEETLFTSRSTNGRDDEETRMERSGRSREYGKTEKKRRSEGKNNNAIIISIVVVIGVILISSLGYFLWKKHGDKQAVVEAPPLPQPQLQSVTLNKKEMSLKVGETDTLKAFVVEDGAVATLIWKVSKDGVVSVDNGVVKALDEGEVVVSLKVAENENLQAKCTYNVRKSKKTEIGPRVSFGTYHGPANGLGGTIVVTKSYELDLNDDDEPLQLSPGDEIQQTKFTNGELRSGVWVHDGYRRAFFR